MKHLKRILAVVLVMLMALTVTACHKKDEIAVTIDDTKFTSAYYMCALMSADSEAKAMVQETLTDEELTKEIDYYSKKVEGKKFVDWVEDEAIENLKKIAAYKELCKTAKIGISADQLNDAKSYASYYWYNYGYGSYYSINGVNFNTYTNYMVDSYYSNVYFEYIYGAKGTKPISADKVRDTIYSNFVIANLLEISLTDKTEAEVTSIKKKVEGYKTDLESGKKTFEEIYKAENPNYTEETDTNKDEPKPKDKYASVVGKEGTIYAYEKYDDINKMKTGEVKIITADDNSGLVLVKKGDIKADPYYLDNLDITARHILADAEFEKTIADYAAKLEADINNFAVGQFKVKKIKEPETSY